MNNREEFKYFDFRLSMISKTDWREAEADIKFLFNYACTKGERLRLTLTYKDLKCGIGDNIFDYYIPANSIVALCERVEARLPNKIIIFKDRNIKKLPVVFQLV